MIGFEIPGGWSVLGHIQGVLARLLDAKLVILPAYPTKRSKAARFIDIAYGRHTGNEIGLVLAPCASNLLSLYEVPGWRRRFRFLAACVFDSWYTDWFSLETRLFDCLFVSRIEDVEPVHQRTRRPVYYAPFATDVMEAGLQMASGTRNIDLLAYGRQPQHYAYEKLGRHAQLAGLTTQLHVPQDENPYRNKHNLFVAAGSAKYALAFCNSVHYHEALPKTSSFLTFRWIDNLAGGAVMAGKLPRPVGFEDVIGWDGAYIDLPEDIDQGMQLLAERKKTYDPKTALHNHYESLIRNDWRIRLRQMFESMGLPINDSLRSELDRHASYRSEIAARLAPKSPSDPVIILQKNRETTGSD